MTDIKTLKKRLIYQSQHRGMKELDAVLGQHVRDNIDTLSEEELVDLENLLNKPDVELYDLWCEGRLESRLRRNDNGGK